MAAPGEPRPARLQHHVAGVATVHRHHRDAALAEQALTPWVVGVDHPLHGVVGGEQQALRREVLLHRPVVVEVVVAQIGEGGHVEMDALHAGLGQGMAGDLHGHRVGPAIGELAVPDLGQHAL